MTFAISMAARAASVPRLISDPRQRSCACASVSRTVLAIPMLRADELLGVIVIYRHEVQPFSDNQIALMETFADQAVIAIENTRLFEEVQARTHELTEALDQQTAASEILGVTGFPLQDDAQSKNRIRPFLERKLPHDDRNFKCARNLMERNNRIRRKRLQFLGGMLDEAPDVLSVKEARDNREMALPLFGAGMGRSKCGHFSICR